MNGVSPTKTDRLDRLLADRGLAAAWFARPPSFAWLTGGDNVVDRAADVGVAAAGYDGDRVTVVTDGIEAPRLRAEELPDDVAVEAYDWHGSDLATAVADRSPTPAAADFEVPGFGTLDPTPLRQPLADGDVDRYRALATETAETLEAVCRHAGRTDTERQVTARLRGDLAARGIDAPVALVGGGDRAGRYRHFTPTDDPLDDYGLVSVTATRDGLFASCTRTVAFDPPEWLRDRHRAAARVEATALAATREAGLAGDTAGDVFDAIRDAYAAVGWPDEWREHHQGGAAGFAGREWIATPTATDPVAIPQAYAWNPTVRGAKSEDTVLVTDDDVAVLTATDDWPTAEVTAVERDRTLERPGILVA